MHVNGEMLRVARQLHGFQQIDAAKKFGIEQPLLSRIENNLTEPSNEFLIKAEAIYECPQSFFSLTDPILGAPVSVHPMWRKKADVSIRDMDKVVAELNVRVMHLRRLLDAAEISTSSSVPRLDSDDYESAEDIAALVRSHWGVPRGPIKNLTDLVEKSGILVCHSNMSGVSVSGVTFQAPGLPPLIVLNKEQPADRLRFTLAHELGHIIMHRFPSPSMEKEANDFASALLMPSNDIRQYFWGRKVDLALLAALKPEWKVAMQALLMRATSLECISKNQSTYLWKQISMRRMRLREPPELDFAPEKPTLIETLLSLHTNDMGYSNDEMANLLHVKKSKLPQFYSFVSNDQTRPKITIVK